MTTDNNWAVEVGETEGGGTFKYKLQDWFLAQVTAIRRRAGRKPEIAVFLLIKFFPKPLKIVDAARIEPITVEC